MADMKILRTIKQKKGASTYLLLFILLPLMLMVPAIAIDVSMYMAAQSHLQNGLDTVLLDSMNKSAIDSYRADKVLKLKDINFFTQKVLESASTNLKGSTSNVGGRVEIDTDVGFVTKYRESGIEYKPNIVITYRANNSNIAGTEYVSGGINNTYTTNYDVELALTSGVKLPMLGGVLKFFTNDDSTLTPKITVKSTIRGIRVQTPDERIYY